MIKSKMTKEQFIEFIDGDIEYLREKMPTCMTRTHIEMCLKKIIDYEYPTAPTIVQQSLSSSEPKGSTPKSCPKCGVKKDLIYICNNPDCAENNGGWA